MPPRCTVSHRAPEVALEEPSANPCLMFVRAPRFVSLSPPAAVTRPNAGSAAVYCFTYLCNSGRTVSATQMSPFGVSVM